MDEQLPVIIFCCLMSQNRELKFVVNFLQHYFERDDYYEPEKRIIAALNVNIILFRLLWSLSIMNGLCMIDNEN